MAKTQKPRNGLGKTGRKFWNRVLAEFVIENEHDLRRLEMAARCLDEIEVAEEVVSREGMYIKDRFQQVREHPGMKTIRDSRGLFARLIRELGLDLQESPESRLPRRY